MNIQNETIGDNSGKLEEKKDNMGANIDAIIEEGKENKEKSPEKKSKEPKPKNTVPKSKPNKAKYQGSVIKKKFAPKKIGAVDHTARPTPIASDYEIVAQIESDEEKNEVKSEDRIEIAHDDKNEDSNIMPLIITEQVESVEDSQEDKQMDEFELVEGIQDAESNEQKFNE